MMQPHGSVPSRGPVPGGSSSVHHGNTPGVHSPMPGQQQQGMASRGVTPSVPSQAVPPGSNMHPGTMQQGMHPHTHPHPHPHPHAQQVMHQHLETPLPEPDRIVIGNRVTVPNMDVTNSAMRGSMGTTGYGIQGAAASAAAAVAAAAGTTGAGLAAAAAAAAAAARQQQYPYGQQYPYDYAALYGAEWQQLMQQRDAAYAAAYGLDRQRPKVSTWPFVFFNMGTELRTFLQQTMWLLNISK